MQQEEATKALTHYEKVQIIFNAVEEAFGAGKEPSAETVWALVQHAGVTKEEVHRYTWHLRGEQIDAED